MNRERQTSILKIIIKEKCVSVNDLAQRLYASRPSIRRDLAALEKQKLIRRVHGGAVIDENGISEIKIPFLTRELEQSDEKTRIAARSSELIKDEDVIFLDASSTAYALIPYIAAKKDITVITNGLKALMKLSEYHITAISTGGNVNASCLAMVGDDAIRTINTYNADLCFFSCRGLSETGELTDISAPENNVRREMIKRAERSYLLCTENKIGHKYYHKLCSVSDRSGVITENELPDKIAKMIGTPIG